MVNIIDTYREFNDMVTLEDVTTRTGKAFRIILTTIGAYDEDGNEEIGTGGCVEVSGLTAENDKIVEAIGKKYEDEGEDVTIYDDVTMICAPNSFKVAGILTYESPARFEEIHKEIVEKLEAL